MKDLKKKCIYRHDKTKRTPRFILYTEKMTEELKVPKPVSVFVLCVSVNVRRSVRVCISRLSPAWETKTESQLKKRRTVGATCM